MLCLCFLIVSSQVVLPSVRLECEFPLIETAKNAERKLGGRAEALTPHLPHGVFI
jgi:hypothetical protein